MRMSDHDVDNAEEFFSDGDLDPQLKVVTPKKKPTVSAFSLHH